MGYDIFKFGALVQRTRPQRMPMMPSMGGDIPRYDTKSLISIESAVSDNAITWVKPHNTNLFVADRVLLVNVSWEDLDKNGFVAGKTVLLDGQCFRCRLLQVGEKGYVLNEWDRILDATNADNAFWHWENVYFWGADISFYDTAYRAGRGYNSARYWNNYSASLRDVNLGFRPALEPLPSDNPTPNINLEGIDFRLSNLPGSDDFCPILQPIQDNIFKDIPVGGKVRMYTLTENGCPIHTDESVKDLSKLVLTDRYFGDEYLFSWVISNGVAIASQSVPQQGKC